MGCLTLEMFAPGCGGLFQLGDDPVEASPVGDPGAVELGLAFVELAAGQRQSAPRLRVVFRNGVEPQTADFKSEFETGLRRWVSPLTAV